MGLDIALGVVVLLAGVRGWFRGFALQAIQLAAMIGCVYAAGPIRDLARPYAAEYLPSIDQALRDRLLWWTAAIITYVGTNGLGSSFIRLQRKRSFADFEPNRGDQGGGFLLGAMKGALLAVMLMSGIQAYGPNNVESGGWTGRQIQTSRALALAAQHRPAEKIWSSAPVQTFVQHIRREGLGETLPVTPAPEAPVAGPAASPAVESTASPTTVQTARRDRSLRLPAPRLDPSSPSFLRDLDRALEREGLEKLPRTR